VDDPSYLASKGYRVVDAEGEVVADYTVGDRVIGDGSSGRKKRFFGILPARHQAGGELPDLRQGLVGERLRLRQVPGAANDLGLIKFMFPNEFSVYLHDTPADHLFARLERDFSHGCIRLEDPEGLAEHVLSINGGWSREAISAKMQDPTVVSEAVTLDRAIPVYIVYLTAWVDHAGRVNFRDDVYGYDEDVRRALGSDAPSTEVVHARERLMRWIGGTGASAGSGGHEPVDDAMSAPAGAVAPHLSPKRDEASQVSSG
jgi:hypothetical protein